VTATATNTPPPTATGVPMCTVPNFIGKKWNDAAGTWSGAGFTGAVVNGGGSSNFTINTQSLPAGTSEPCSSSITLGP
jgi:hypothetical protein